MKVHTRSCLFVLRRKRRSILIQQASWNLRELNRFLQEDGKEELPFYDWSWEEYNNRIKEMYEEINSTRKEYEGRIEQLKQSNEQLKQDKIDKDKK